MAGRQGELFSQDVPEWELDAAASTRAASIVFAENPWGPFHYRIPEEMSALQIGMRVKVPLGKGNREIVGYCVEIETVKLPSERLKPIAEIVDAGPLCSGNLLKLVQWMARYYITPLGQVLEAVIPAGVRSQAGTRMKTLLVPSTSAGNTSLVEKLHRSNGKYFNNSSWRPGRSTSSSFERWPIVPQPLFKHCVRRASSSRVRNASLTASVRLGNNRRKLPRRP